MYKEILVKELEGLKTEICSDEIESSNSLVNLIDGVIGYMEDGNEIFMDDNCEYESLDELTEILEETIDELRYDDASSEMISVLSKARDIMR